MYMSLVVLFSYVTPPYTNKSGASYHTYACVLLGGGFPVVFFILH